MVGKFAVSVIILELLLTKGVLAQGACPRMESLLRKSDFGPFSRSISLNMNNYSPQLLEKPDSKWLSLATTSILGQTPRGVNV